VHVVLVQPEIAPNTGNIIRLCAITGNDLHLVEPLGFEMSDRLLRRGGLDYHERTNVTVHSDIEALPQILPGRWFTFSSQSSRSYADVQFAHDDVLVFGAERSGLSTTDAERVPPQNRLTIPMRPDNRSLNLANAVAIVTYEAWRQRDFDGSSESNDGGELTSERPGSPPFDN
jgi:tRNA (cytidine/uridine-2'-O-)-methyltransferase